MLFVDVYTKYIRYNFFIVKFDKINKYKRKYRENIFVGKKITDGQKITDERFTNGEFPLVIPSVN
jgi:hypothetical protein